MPHLILEYSSNVPDRVDFQLLFKELHELLTNTGEFKLDQIKSRWRCHENFRVGDGSQNAAFVYLQLAMLSGREEQLRSRLAEEALKIIQRFFPVAQSELTCSMTVEVREIDRDTHARGVKAAVRAGKI